MEWVQSVNHRHAEQKCMICSASEPCSVIRSAQKPVFRGYYSMHTFRCAELEIWQFSWRRQTDRQQTDKTDCFTPCTCVRGNYLHITSSYCVHGQKAHGLQLTLRYIHVHVCTWPIKTQSLVTLVGLAKRFEAKLTQISLISTVSLYLRVAQMPRYDNLAIFMMTVG